jgi:enterochelin esterase family protein
VPGPPRPPRPARPAPLPLAGSDRISRLAVAAAGGGPGARAAGEAFWTAVRAEGTPLLEPGATPGRTVVTFVYRLPADGRRVLLLANRLTDPDDPDATVLRRVPGTDVGALSLELADDWRASYQFLVLPGAAAPDAGRDGPALRAAGLPDPLNPRRLPPRAGSAEASVVELPAAPPQPWWAPRPGVAGGSLTRHELPAGVLGRPRTVWHYLPAGNRRPLDRVVLLDGEVWATQLSVVPTLDNLIASGQVPPVEVLLPEATDRSRRWVDLGCSPAFLTFLVDELLPWSTRRTGLSRPALIAGQSLGGLTAVWAALRAPGAFDRALAQSGSFWWPGPEEQLTADLLAGRLPGDGRRLHLQVGSREEVLVDATDRLAGAARAAGARVSTTVFSGGHDHACWRGGLADGLVELLTDRPHHSTRVDA